MAKQIPNKILIAFTLLALQATLAAACPFQHPQLPSPTTLVNEFEGTPKVPVQLVSATVAIDSNEDEYAVAPPQLFEDPSDWVEHTNAPAFKEPVASFESTEFAPITMETVKAQPAASFKSTEDVPITLESAKGKSAVEQQAANEPVTIESGVVEPSFAEPSIPAPSIPAPLTIEPVIAQPVTGKVASEAPNFAEPNQSDLLLVDPGGPVDLVGPVTNSTEPILEPALPQIIFEEPAAITGTSSFPTTGANGFQAANRFEDRSWYQPEAGATYKSSPIVQHNFQTSSQQFVPTAQGAASTPRQPSAAPTPGHNERVNMNRDLSLSPTPQPGQPLREYLPNQPPAFAATEYLPNFDPQVGHRRAQPIRRADIYPLDDGEKFDFQTKKRDFPPFNEIIATGRFFYMAEVLWAEPQFQGNTAIATEAVNFGESISNDFDSDFHPRFRVGFESQYGPGVELTYFNINSNSEIASFTSDGIVTGQTNAWVIGRNVWSRILADDAGEILTSQHSIDIDSFTVSFFKELKFPISRVNGNFGFQYVSIAQQLNASVVSGNGATVESLQSVSDMRAFGPRAILEYYRPIGHTPLELVTTFGGAVLFGQRDQRVANSQTGLENRLGADEFLTILDFLVAVQYKKTVGENRSVYGRFGFMNQTWIGGGSAVFPQGDFGLRGLTFGIGYNR